MQLFGQKLLSWLLSACLIMLSNKDELQTHIHSQSQLWKCITWRSIIKMKPVLNGCRSWLVALIVLQKQWVILSDLVFLAMNAITIVAPMQYSFAMGVCQTVWNVKHSSALFWNTLLNGRSHKAFLCARWDFLCLFVWTHNSHKQQNTSDRLQNETLHSNLYNNL